MNADQEPRIEPGGVTGPGAGSDNVGSRSDEAELTDRLTAIADHRAPAPDWADVVRRAESPPVVALHGAGVGDRRGPFGRPMLAVAAALLLVIGGIGLVVATRGDDDESVESGPAGVDEPDLIDTGWYVPSPLPDGWEITSIEASTMTLVGPGTLAVWAHPDGSGALTYASEPFDGGIPWDGEPIRLTDEITGTFLAYEAAAGGAVSWEHDDLLHLVIGVGVTSDDAEAAARQMAADPTARTSPVEGMELINWSERRYTEVETTDVVVTFHTPGDAEIYLQLSPPEGMGRGWMMGTIPVVREVDGQPLDIFELEGQPGSSSGMTRYLGIWPGAEVSLSMFDPSGFPEGSQVATDDDAMALLRSLRPATADQWRAFVEGTGLEVDEQLLQADRLIDLSDPVDSGSASGGETTDPLSEYSMFDMVTVWPDEALSQFSPTVGSYGLGGTGPGTIVASGSRAAFSLQYRNTADQAYVVNQCTAEATVVGFAPVDRVEPLPLPDITGCDPAVEVMRFAPGEEAGWVLPGRYAAGIPAREIATSADGSYLGGTLTPGEYYFVLYVPGRPREMFTMFGLVTITAHPCDGFTTDFVDGYVYGTLAEAEAQAVADGMALRVVSIDGVDQAITGDLRCDRVDVAIDGGRVVEVVGVG